MNLHHHHVYIIEGKSEHIIPEIKKDITDSSVIDIFEYVFEGLSIDNARMIKELDSKAPLQGDKKYIIISLNSITREAQNALLKVFEDPSPSSRFLFVVPSSKIFIETVLSRVEIIRHESFGLNESPLDPEIFVKSSCATRLKMVADTISRIEKEELSKQDIFYFFGALKIYLEKHISKEEGHKKMLKIVLDNMRFLPDKSSSIKLLLERVCLC